MKTCAATRLFTDDDDVSVLIEHKILQFDIAMNDVSPMHVVNGRNDLSNVLARFVFVQLTSGTTNVVFSSSSPRFFTFASNI